jgi:hypothetical protein
MARTYNGSSQYAEVSAGLGITGNDPVWASFWLWPNSTATSYGIFNIGISGSTNHYRRVVSGGGNILATSGGAGTSASASVALAGAAQWQHVLAEWGGQSTRKIAVNNAAPGTNTTAINITGDPNLVRLAATLNLSAYLAGRLAWLGVFSGVPTDDQKAAAAAGLHPTLLSPSTLLDAWDKYGIGTETSWRGNTLTLVNSPTQSDSPRIYLPRGRSMIVVPSSGTAYTLACDSVAYNWTPTDASLLAHRKVDAQTVGFTWAPTAAGVLVAHKLTADSVPYAWSPTDATLLRAYRLAADSVAYAWSPTSAAVQYARRMVADSVAYNWTPSDASLVKVGDYELLAESVSYGATATAATLTVSRRLAADSVSYSATATAADLRAARVLTAATVSYAWQPTAAGLLTGHVMSAESVAFAWAPTDAALRSDRVMVVGSVGYVWTPTAADLDYSGEVVPPTYTTLLVAAARAGTATIAARAGRTSIAARSHLSE